MPKTPLPEPAYLRERLRYEPKTGLLYWRTHPAMEDRWNTRWGGRETGGVCGSDGYRTVCIDGRSFRAHKVVWALVYNNWPSSQIDHIDHCRTNNRIENLRLADQTANSRNASLHRRNTSGVTGVRWHKGRGGWYSDIGVDGRVLWLGLFDNFDDAVAARKAAERRFGFHLNHGKP